MPRSDSDSGRGGAARNVILWGGLLLVLGMVNAMITGKERMLADGDTILLELAPRDPRSLLQGDYMTLRYAMSAEVSRALERPVATAIFPTDRQEGLSLADGRDTSIYPDRTFAATLSDADIADFETMPTRFFALWGRRTHLDDRLTLARKSPRDIKYLTKSVCLFGRTVYIF